LVRATDHTTHDRGSVVAALLTEGVAVAGGVHRRGPARPRDELAALPLPRRHGARNHRAREGPGSAAGSHLL